MIQATERRARTRFVATSSTDITSRASETFAARHGNGPRRRRGGELPLTTCGRHCTRHTNGPPRLPPILGRSCMRKEAAGSRGGRRNRLPWPRRQPRTAEWERTYLPSSSQAPKEYGPRGQESCTPQVESLLGSLLVTRLMTTALISQLNTGSGECRCDGGGKRGGAPRHARLPSTIRGHPRPWQRGSLDTSGLRTREGVGTRV